MNAAHYRRAVIEAVIARLLPMGAVRALFEGGSAATGRLDDYSDIDLVIVAPLAAADEAFDGVEAALAPHIISHVWRVDPPPFPDTAQRFYFLADAPRFFAVDCVVVTEAAAGQFLERERHGTPLVYFDRTGKIRARPADATALALRRTRRWKQLQGAVPIYAMLVDKELTRGRPLEAMGFYQALLRALIEVLGIAHRPDRFDFGWRYVETQLPEDERKRLARFAFVADPTALRERAPELVAELLQRLRAQPT
jgi:predicted nucleotidyltransferase